jgi:hypothetical protein
MKNFPLLFCFVLFFAFAVSAQTNQDSSCPTVNVRGGGVPSLNEISYFTADVDKKGKELEIEYIWTVHGGEIVEGQGTKTIAVKVLGDGLSATVEIKGFPADCPNIDMESVIWDPAPKAVKIGEFLDFVLPTEKKRLEELRKNIADYPSAQVYVISRFKENTSEKKVGQKLKKIGAFLMKEFSSEASRITLTRVFGESEYSEIWLVPPGADNPQP